MLGFNGGLIGVERTTSAIAAPGAWTLPEQVVARRASRWPNDPYFANVSLLLLGNGTNGSTTILDSSPSPKTVTAVGNAQISTAQSKFGGASLYTGESGTSSVFTIPATSAFVFGAGDFTVESWFYLIGGGNYARLVSCGTSAWGTTTSWGINIKDLDNPGKLSFAVFNLSSSVRVCVSTTTIQTNTWYHVAVTRSVGVFRLFINGTLESTNSSYLSGQTMETQATNQMRIGNHPYTNQEHVYGYIDDLRITKGVARYTSNFTPPANQLPS